jgi:hypothetical protein
MKHKDIEKWKTAHGTNLTIGTEVIVNIKSHRFDFGYDNGQKNIVTSLNLDSVGVEIGLSMGTPLESRFESHLCTEGEGYRIDDLLPFV